MVRPAAQPLRISCSEDEQAWIIAVSGELDLATAPLLAGVFEKIMVREPSESRPELLVVDLTELSLLSAAGLTVLYATHQLAAEVGLRLRLVTSGRSPAARALRISGLGSVLDLYQSLSAAAAGPPSVGNP